MKDERRADFSRPWPVWLASSLPNYGDTCTIPFPPGLFDAPSSIRGKPARRNFRPRERRPLVPSPQGPRRGDARAVRPRRPAPVGHASRRSKARGSTHANGLKIVGARCAGRATCPPRVEAFAAERQRGGRHARTLARREAPRRRAVKGWGSAGQAMAPLSVCDTKRFIGAAAPPAAPWSASCTNPRFTARTISPLSTR